MIKQKTFGLGLIITVVAISLIAGGLIISCGDGGSGSSNNDAVSFTAPFNDDLKNIPLNKGENQEFVFTYTISNDLSAKNKFRINVSETLANTYLSAGPTANAPSKLKMIKMMAHLIIKEAFAAESSQMTVHISYAGDPDVCNSPFVYGPYGISGAIDSALSSTTASVSPNRSTADILNSGSFEICAKATPPIDAYLTVSGVVVDYEDCETSEFEIVGEWTGYYECTEFGEPQGEQNTPILLTITKNEDGSYRYIDDTGATYEGYLCGNKYRYDGGYEGYSSESGTMIFESNSSATKTSIYNSLTESERLRCSDTLHKTSASGSQ